MIQTIVEDFFGQTFSTSKDAADWLHARIDAAIREAVKEWSLRESALETELLTDNDAMAFKLTMSESENKRLKAEMAESEKKEILYSGQCPHGHAMGQPCGPCGRWDGQ